MAFLDYSENELYTTSSATRHLNKRIKERTGLPKRSHTKFLEKAMSKGIRIENIKPNSMLYYYMKSITKQGYILVIYDIYVLVMSECGIGITILNLPKEYRKLSNPRRIESYDKRPSHCREDPFEEQ